MTGYAQLKKADRLEQRLYIATDGNANCSKNSARTFTKIAGKLLFVPHENNT